MALFNTALITGATSGLGFQISLKILPYVDRILVVGRSEKKLQILTQFLQKQDTTRSVSCIPVLYDFQKPLQGSLLYQSITMYNPDLLINNCGIGKYGIFQKELFPYHEELVVVNLLRTMELTHVWLNQSSALPNRKKCVCTIASLASCIPTPGMAVYGATKSALLSWMEAIRTEIAYSGMNIQALTVCPGSFQTAFQRRAAHRDDVSEEGIEDMIFLEAEPLATRIIKCITKGKNGVYYPGKWALERLFLRILPKELLQRGILKKILERLHLDK